MMDETSIITALARKGAQSMKEPPKERADDGALVRALADAERRVQQVESATRAAIAEINRQRDEYEKTIAAVRSELAVKETLCAQLQARCDMLEKREPEVRYQENAADPTLRENNDRLRSEIASLQVECAQCRGERDELRRSVTQLESTIEWHRSVTVEEPEKEEETKEPLGCDIDVVRGGDDRIRTLRVRYT